MARYLLGAVIPAKTADWERPATFTTFSEKDMEIIKAEADKLGAKTILEFGPGNTTEVLAVLGYQITSVEHIDKWYEAAKTRFAEYPNVRILKGNDEIPFTVEGLGDEERFDLAFVDAPAGYVPVRKVHKGYEECNRFNTTLLALERCPVVFLHDANRPCERAAMTRLRLMGYKYEFTDSPYFTARLTHADQSEPDLSSAKKPRRAPARAKPKRRRVSVDERLGGRDGSRA